MFLAPIFVIFAIVFVLVFIARLFFPALSFLSKLIAGTTTIGSSYLVKSFQILTQKWWSWLIQLPILFCQTAAFIGAYMKNQIGLGFFLVIVFQIIASTIIFNIQRIIQKDY